MIRPNATAAEPTPVDPIEGLRKLFVDVTQKNRILAGQAPARRAVFLKPHGSAYGRFRMRPDRPNALRIGVFASKEFSAWVRFSSDTIPGLPDTKTTCGVGIKLFGVPGTKLLEPDALTHDFVLQNIDVFFVDNAQEMYAFTYAGVVLRDYESYLRDHPKTRAILDRMRHDVASVARIDYWSCLPSHLGADQYVKYKLVAQPDGHDGIDAAASDPNYLATDLKARLLRGEVRFTFCVQPRTDPATMPLDEATVAWSEAASPPVAVADLVLPQQDVDAPGQAAYAENLSYSAWHALPDHQPVGSIQDARKVVYASSAQLRRDRNGIALVEPRAPRNTP